MSIIFHCESCKKKVKAPDGAGGQWGSCPFCSHRCYIPLPPAADEEELRLMPVEGDYEQEYKQLMRETYNITQNILQETTLPSEHGTAVQTALSEKDAIKNIILYLRQMADGLLPQAEGTVEKLRGSKNISRDILARMLKAERPEPELADIAPRILQGLIKDLHSKL